MQTRPYVQGVQENALLGPALAVLDSRSAKGIGEKPERVLGFLHHLGVIIPIWKRRPEHQTVLKRVRQRKIEIGAAHSAKIGIGILAWRTRIEMMRKGLEGTRNNLSQKMVTAGKMPVRSLMGDLQVPGHLPQAQLLKALAVNDSQCLGKAGFT
jgi:hypothetical protein